MELSAYLRFIGWPEPEKKIICDLQTLKRLQYHHSTSIPFDNFDLHDDSVKLSINAEDVWNKVKDGKRGTFCFQGNSLFAAALKLMGYDAILVPVRTWRPMVGEYSPIPSHCSVVVSIDNKWILIDVATIDCIDGILSLSEPIGTIQTMENGVSYKFSVQPYPSESLPEDLSRKFQELDKDYLSGKQLTVSLLKEDIKRDPTTFLPLEPLQKSWTGRFALELPLKDQSTFPENPEKMLNLHDVAELPKTLDEGLGIFLLEETTLRDPRSHHYKQWVGMRYSKDRQWKFIVAGFRYIVAGRPYGERTITVYKKGFVEDEEKEVDKDVIQSNFDQVLKHLNDDVGIELSSDVLANLKIRHNFTQPNVEHVWAF